MSIIVLSKSFQETNAFMRQKGLGYGPRHVTNADSLRGTSPTEVHVLPSFYERRDIHAVEAALKRAIRRSHKCERVEYEKSPVSGTWVVASDHARVDDPPINPRPDKPEAFGDDMTATDTSKDAVPGQSSLGEFIQAEVEHAEKVSGPDANQNPRVDPNEDLLDFLDG